MVRFPIQDDLHRWIRLIQQTEGDRLAEYLPHIDEEWFGEMISCVQLTSMNPACQAHIACAGAKLFYKIIKNHHRVDGNKRSALIVFTLFCFVNKQFVVLEPKEMYRLAARVASEIRKQDEVEAELEQTFIHHIQPLSLFF